MEFGDFGWPLHAKNRKSMNSLFLEMFPFSVKQDDVERFAVAVWLSRRGFWICCYCSRSKPRCYCSRSKPPAASHLWNSYTTTKQEARTYIFFRILKILTLICSPFFSLSLGFIFVEHFRIRNSDTHTHTHHTPTHWTVVLEWSPVVVLASGGGRLYIKRPAAKRGAPPI